MGWALLFPHRCLSDRRFASATADRRSREDVLDEPTGPANGASGALKRLMLAEERDLVAASEGERQRIWRLRHALVELDLPKA